MRRLFRQAFDTPCWRGLTGLLSAGNDRDGEAAGTFFSIIESPRRADLDLWDCITDLLKRPSSRPRIRLEELLPDWWRPKGP